MFEVTWSFINLTYIESSLSLSLLKDDPFIDTMKDLLTHPNKFIVGQVIWILSNLVTSPDHQQRRFELLQDGVIFKAVLSLLDADESFSAIVDSTIDSLHGFCASYDSFSIRGHEPVIPYTEKLIQLLANFIYSDKKERLRSITVVLSLLAE